MFLSHHGHLTDLEKRLVGWIGLSVPNPYKNIVASSLGADHMEPQRPLVSLETEIHGANNVDYQEKQQFPW